METWPGSRMEPCPSSMMEAPGTVPPPAPPFLHLQLVLSFAGGNFFSLSLSTSPWLFVLPGKVEEEDLARSLCLPPQVARLPPGLSRDWCVPRALPQAPVVALSPWGGVRREAGDWAIIHRVSASPRCCVVSYRLPLAWSNL